MDIDTFYSAEFDEHADVMQQTRDACAQPFGELLSRCAQSVRHGGKIIFFGNGGSAADCQHLATELTIRYKTDRAPIAAIALTTDTSALTAGGNDLGFENIFSRQIEAIGKPGDVAIGISTSGNSENVIRALKTAQARDIVAAAFGGKDGGKLVGLADPLLIVPSDTTARIQEMHIMLGQMLCGALEIELGLV
ncbi:MAG: D-sedoheptulose 7-phosphate isomerase [Rhodospirillales bacterium]|nr:D-sedoheptulose 7-phosphate isomerase [Rhodospirillales bacterium]MBO6788453.1 D-sedoheptulose 7-phosphate isomerase [Rhodospirillales bacterium]